jgi:hypothetical protein
MEYYSLIFAAFLATCLVLTCIVVTASFYKSRKAYLIALASYSVIAVASGLIAIVPYISGVYLSTAHGLYEVSTTEYIIPILMFVGILYPALSFYPFMSVRNGRIVAFAFAGLSVTFVIVSFIAAALRWPMDQSLDRYYFQSGFTSLFHLLLWLRVYDLRTVSEESPKVA